VTGDEYAITSLLHPVSTADHFGGNINERPSKKKKKTFYLCDEFHRTIFLDTFQKKMKTPTKHSSMFLFHGTSYAAIQTFFYKAFAFSHKKINRQRAKKKNIFGRTFFKVLTQLSRAS
jgi:hypothetical protein